MASEDVHDLAGTIRLKNNQARLNQDKVDGSNVLVIYREARKFPGVKKRPFRVMIARVFSTGKPDILQEGRLWRLQDLQIISMYRSSGMANT